MNRHRFLAATTALAVALGSPLSASVRINLSAAVLSNSIGTAMPDTGLVLLVASTTNSTFTAPPSTASTSVNAIIADDDIVIGKVAINSASAGGVAGGFTIPLDINLTGNLNAGDPVQLYWFPTLTSSSTTLGQATAYGSYRTDSASAGSDAWVLPSDGATADLKMLTVSAGGGIADTSGRATSSTDGTIVTAPVITTQPVSQTKDVGTSVTFSVTTTGTSPNYQWKKNGQNVPINGTSSTYTIQSVTSGDAGNYTVDVANSAGTASSNIATLTVTIPAPTITTQPASTTVNAGSAATFTVAATSTGLSYQWRKGTTNISGATSASYTINSTTLADAGSYNVVVTNSAGNVTSNNATLAVLPVFTAPAPDGYAASVTGGGTATTSNHTLVTTASEFRTLAESNSTAVITVSGSLDLGSTKVAVKSNKTIQGLNDSATITGNLEVAAGVSNVVIRGLNITNPNGDGITVAGATSVYITHVSFYNCSDTLLRISGGADNVTVTWCEFYYTSASAHRYATLIGASTGETKALRVTLAYNWYSDRVDQQLPDSTYGQVHLFNNYFNANGTANTSGSIARANAQFLAERNQYTGIVSPLTKTGGGLVRDLGNGYSANAPAADTVADAVFTPSYSYRLMNRTDVATLVSAGAGNTAGASSASLNPGSASINASGTSITTGSSFTLTASNVSGLTASAYQWRLNNVDIAGATSASYNVASAQSANAGIYTVAASNVSGETIVSSPVTISVNAAPTTPPAAAGGGGGGGGGGGAPSTWFLLALGALAGLRRLTRKN